MATALAKERYRSLVSRQTMGGGVLVLLAAVLRVPGLFTDLWLDEIWSLDAVEPMWSWLEVFTVFGSDNNHHLNSLWLYVLGPDAAGWAYRLLAWVAGLVGVVLAWLLGVRDDRREGWASALLVATSLPLVVYSSEARGYALVVAAALGAWYSVQRFAERPTWARAWPFWGCIALGVLAHLSIVHTLVASAVWLGVRERRRVGSWSAAVPVLAVALAVPVISASLFAWVALRGAVLGGGPPYSLTAVIAETLASAAGVVGNGPPAFLAATVVASLFMLSLWRLEKRGDDRWVFFAVVVLAAPAFLLVAARPPFLFARYFATQVAFVLLAVATLAKETPAGSRVERRLVLGLVGAAVVANLVAVVNFWSVGRGHYQAALSDICAESPDGRASIASDHDFRVGTIVVFYTRHGRPGCQIDYLAKSSLSAEGARWFIVHALEPRDHPRSRAVDVHGNHYTYARTYPAHRLSGTTWHLYRAAGR